jgi:3-dehydroquinate dehydratase-2
MKKILLLHGANLNLLGKRNPEHYGNITLGELEALVTQTAKEDGYTVMAYQSNHEGRLIDQLQSEAGECAGIIINPGAFSHYSYALHDALLDTLKPVVEVHLSDIKQREVWRQHSVITPACIHMICGKQAAGYVEAMKYLVEHLNVN